jgi:hypothetical protein
VVSLLAAPVPSAEAAQPVLTSSDRLMHDDDGPVVARSFYEYLFQSEALDLDDVPYALDAAVRFLREAGVTASRWALFVHMGG